MVLTLAGTDPGAHRRVQAVRQQVLADRAAFWDAIEIRLREISRSGGSGGHHSPMLCSSLI